MVTQPVVEWPPLMDQYLRDLAYFTLSLSLSSRDEESYLGSLGAEIKVAPSTTRPEGG